MVVCYLLFLGLYALLVSFDENGLQVRDRVALAVVHGLALVLVAALVLVVGYTLWKGRSALRHLNFFTQDITRAGPLEPLTVGGILHARRRHARADRDRAGHHGPARADLRGLPERDPRPASPGSSAPSPRP